MLASLLESWKKLTPVEKEYWVGRKEKDFENEVCSSLAACGIKCVRIPDRTEDYVFPDRLCHVRFTDGTSYTFYIEFKRYGLDYSSGQKINFAELVNYCDIFLVNSFGSLIKLLEILYGICLKHSAIQA